MKKRTSLLEVLIYLSLSVLFAVVAGYTHVWFWLASSITIGYAALVGAHTRGMKVVNEYDKQIRLSVYPEK